MSSSRSAGHEELERLTQRAEAVERSRGGSTHRTRPAGPSVDRAGAGVRGARPRDERAGASANCGAWQEEERGRTDVLNLAVLVANTEQSLVAISLRAQEVTDRDGRLAREREEIHLSTMPRRTGARRSSRPARQRSNRGGPASAAAAVLNRSGASVSAGLAEVEQLLSSIGGVGRSGLSPASPARRVAGRYGLWAVG